MKFSKKVLKNGLRVVTIPMKDNPTVTVLVLVEAGSKYETKRVNGISHFLEHMCFKGTKKRPSAAEVHKAFDELGAISNAFTSSEVTGYWAKADYKNVLKILDIVSDIYLNTIFKKEDLTKEKGVITEEINMYEDKPEAMVAELFDKEMHGNQPAGLPVIGNKKSVNSFTVKDLYNYHAKHYVAKATTIIVAGRFNQSEIRSKTKPQYLINLSFFPKSF